MESLFWPVSLSYFRSSLVFAKVFEWELFLQWSCLWKEEETDLFVLQTHQSRIQAGPPGPDPGPVKLGIASGWGRKGWLGTITEKDWKWWILNCWFWKCSKLNMLFSLLYFPLSFCLEEKLYLKVLCFGVSQLLVRHWRLYFSHWGRLENQYDFISGWASVLTSSWILTIFSNEQRRKHFNLTEKSSSAFITHPFHPQGRLEGEYIQWRKTENKRAATTIVIYVHSYCVEGKSEKMRDTNGGDELSDLRLHNVRNDEGIKKPYFLIAHILFWPQDKTQCF